MAKEKDTKQTILDLVGEAKNYYGLQKKYLKVTAAEQLTKVLSQLIIVMTMAVVGFVVFIFAGLAVVHYAGNLTGNLPLCFALYALLLLLVLVVFYRNRRKWVMLPLAQMMTEVFLTDDEEEENRKEATDE